MSLTKVQQAEQMCEQLGERFTEPRRIVYSLLLQANSALTAYQLLEQLQKLKPGAKPPTVYRALEFLLKLKLIHRIDSSNAYLACNAENHGHQAQFLICNQCGQIKEVELKQLEPEILKVCAEQKFKPEQQIIEVRGLCFQCQQGT